MSVRTDSQREEWLAQLDLQPFKARPRDAETALKGMRVVDFSHFVAGPFCSMILGDMGADVIKIESPGKGDEYRYSGLREASLNGEGSSFLWSNRNKRSIVLDLKTDDARRIAHELVATADVVLENFSAGVMKKLGLDYEDCARINPRVVYCSVSAYGRDGAFADRRGFDTVVQSESGFITMNGLPQDSGFQTDSTVMDIATAMMACNTVLAALISRGETGHGQRVGTSLYDTSLTMVGFATMQYLMSGQLPIRQGNFSSYSSPDGVYAAADVRFYLSCPTSASFRSLFIDVIGRPDVANDPAFSGFDSRLKQRDRLASLLNSVFPSQPLQYWAPRLHAAGVAYGELRTLPEGLQSPEARDSGLVTKIPHPTARIVPNIALPIAMEGTPLADPVAAPIHGQHTREVLAEVLGYDTDRIKELAEGGCFGRHSPDPLRELQEGHGVSR